MIFGVAVISVLGVLSALYYRRQVAALRLQLRASDLRADQASDQLKAQLSFALETARFGSYEVDLQTSRLRASSEMAELWGLTLNERVSERTAFQSRVHPDDLQPMVDAIDGAIRNRSVYELDYRIFPRPGVEKWVLSRGRCSYDPVTGEAVTFTGVVADITDRKRQEAREHALFELSESGACEIDPQTKRFDKVNRRFQEMTGYDENELRQITLPELVEPDDRLQFDTDFKDLMQSRRTNWRCELRLRLRSGKTGWVICNGFIQRDSSGQAVGILTTFYDVTGLKETQVALERSVQSRDTFLTIASHELRTPLTSLLLQIELRQRELRRGVDLSIEKLQLSFEKQLQAVRRISKLIDDILDVGRLSEKKMVYKASAFELGAMAKAVIERMGENESGGPRVSLEVREDVVGMWDQFRIEQVLINFLTNAVRYGNEKPIEVRVWSESGSAYLSVKDHGRGISATDQARIFERFERAISASEVSGLGVGLYISREIVNAHGGQIKVQSDETSGSTFTIILPQESERVS